MKPPSILYVTATVPAGPVFGGMLRTMGVLGELRKVSRVTIVVVPRTCPDESLVTNAKKSWGEVHVMPLRPKSVSGLRDRIAHEISPKYINSHGWELQPSDQNRMTALMTENDMVWIHGLSTANNTGIWKWPHSILDIDDIPSQYHLSRRRSANSAYQWLHASRAIGLWKRRESQLKNRFQILAVCSQADREYLGGGDRVMVIPNGFGFEVPQASAHEPVQPPRIGFIGTLNYPPNADGIEWFIQSIWPLIRKEIPDTRLRLVGQDSEGRMKAQAQGIDRLGFIEDAAAEIASWSATIVPIRIGGGTRIKIAEAFSRKCPVVSTHWGAFGYDVADQRELLLADRERDFASACVRLIADPTLGAELAERAWASYLERWTWPAIGTAIALAAERCMQEQDRRRIAHIKPSDSGTELEHAVS